MAEPTTTRGTQALIVVVCIAWVAAAAASVAAFGLLRGLLLGVWGVSIAMAASAALVGVAARRLERRRADPDERTIDVLAERELQTI